MPVRTGLPTASAPASSALKILQLSEKNRLPLRWTGTKVRTMKRLFLPAALCLVVSGALAIEAVTPPVGFVKLTIPGATGGNPKSVSISIPLHAAPVGNGAVSGRLTGAFANKLQNDSAGWTAGAFAQTGSPYFVRFVSGTAEGRTLQITANSNTELTVNNEGTDLTTIGIASTGPEADLYEIFPGDTLTTLFGSDVMPGVSAEVADNVLIWNGTAWQRFFFDSVDNRWEQKGIPVNANNFVIRPDAGIMFVRRSSEGLELELMGRVPISNLKYVVRNGGTTFVANGFPAEQTLQQHAFQNMAGWISKPASEVAAADKLHVWNGTGWQKFFFDSVDNRWEQVGINLAANSFKPPVGRPFMIERVGGTGITVFQHGRPYALN